ncbi:MAG: MarR family transcriptional regulator [Actinobacteria bacterium]|nr:MarR family transcriptional regulator [Actinomycetota bacterium]
MSKGNPPQPRLSLGRQIAMTAKQTREWADRVFAENGGSLVTWIVLQHASQAQPPGFSQRELAGHMSIGGPALVRHLDRLESEGLVERQPDPNDRRVTRVSITAKGRRQHAALAEVAKRVDDQLAESLTERELRIVLPALARIERHAAMLNAATTPKRPESA